jgi:hypothetical protein
MRSAITAVAAGSFREPIPGPLLEPRHLGLGPQHARVGGLLQGLHLGLGLLAQTARRRVDHHRRRSRRGQQLRLLLDDGGVVALEGLAGRRQPGGLGPAVDEVAQPDEVGARVGGALAPEVGVPAIAQNGEASLEPGHRQQRVAHAARQTQRRQGLAGDFPVHRHQAPHRAQAEHADSSEHHDDQRESQEDL